MAQAAVEDVTVEEKGRNFSFQDVFFHEIVENYGANIYLHVCVFNCTQIPEERYVRTTFEELAKHHHALQMKITKKKGTASKFEVMDDPYKVDLRVTAISNKDQWVDIVKEENADLINWKDGPLWRGIFCPIEEGVEDEELPKQFAVMFKAHHCIADAVSVFDMFYRQFLPILSAVTNSSDHTQILTKDVPQAAPAEVLFLEESKRQNPVPWYKKLAVDILRWKNRTFGVKKLPVMKYKDESIDEKLPSSFNCKPMVFSKELTTGMLKQAKAHEVTVHCVLLGVNSLALCATAADAGVELPKSITQGWPADSRKFTDYSTPQPLGALTCGGFTTTKRASDMTPVEFWKLCKKIASGVKSSTTKDKIIEFAGFGKIVSDLLENMSVLQMLDELSWLLVGSISNLGNCDRGPHPSLSDGDTKFKLNEQHFMLLSKERADFQPFFHGVSCTNGRLMWNLCYNVFTISEKFVETYKTNIKKFLQKYCNEVKE